ncbi:MAG: condensation domain-containing protein [Bacillus sp. (in: firmicutes)]|uniref:condensation domain-containing protein n=1 Tax=Bacillus sp. TaxID=1409 RepID=UPI0039E4270C
MYIETDSYINSEIFWRKKLEEPLPWSEFPSSISQNSNNLYKEESFQTTFDYTLIDIVYSFSKEHHISIYRVLLHQMTNQNDLVVGIPINMRQRNTQEKIYLVTL